MPEPSELPAFGKPIWLLWSWCRGDALPVCSGVSGLAVEESTHVELLSHLMGILEAALSEQLRLGHRAYLARLGTLPVAVGWSATGEVALLGGRVTLHVPPNHRYLYGFVTHPDWRGRGIYPHLLQTILRTEEQEALLDHAPARGYGFPTRDTQSWLSTRWSFILLTHRWTWLASTSWR